MTWLARLDDPAIHQYAVVTVEGTPYLFTSQELPAAMVAGYEQIVCLDLTNGIEVPQSPLERKSGVASPQSFSIKLGPRNAERLIQVCSPNAASFRAKLTADFNYNDTKLYCTTAGGPIATEYVYIGREACLVDSVNAAWFNLNVVGNREKFDSVQWAFRSAATKYVTDQPEIFEKRLVHLWVGLCDDAGAPLDAALGGANQVEAIAGQIQSLSIGEDFQSWEIKALTIEKALDLTIGAESQAGHLHVYATDSAPQGSVYLGIQTWGGYVYPGQNTIHIEASDSGATATVEIKVPTGQTDNLGAAVGEAITAQLNAAAAWNGVWSAYCGIYPSDVNDDNGDVLDNLVYHCIQIVSDDAVGPATVEITVKPGSVLPAIGWTYSTPTTFLKAGAGPGYYQRVWEWDSPLNALFVAANAPSVFVFLDNPSKWSSTGFVRIGNDPDAEVAQFSAVTAFLTDSLYRITFSKRGALGTKARDVWVSFTEAIQASDGEESYGNTWLKTTEQIQISLLAGLDSVDVFTMLLSACVSTGTAGVRGTYDVAGIPVGFGGSLQDDLFNTASFVEASANTRTLLTERNMAWQRPMSLSGWLSEELAFLGYTLQGRRGQDGRFRLTLDKVKDPLLVSARSLVSTDVANTGTASLKRSGIGVVNTAQASLVYNPGTEEFEGDPWTINEVDSQERYGKQAAISLQAKGLARTIATARAAAETQILAMMSHFSRPYETLTVPVKRSYWKYSPGDQIAVTLAYLPNNDGTLGWVDEACVVLAVSPVYLGKGKKPSAVLELLHMPDRRCTYYVPTAEVTGWVVGTKTLTVAANTYSNASVPFPPDPSLLCSDVLWFTEVGSKIMIANEGDELAQEMLTIASVNTTTREIVVTLAPALTVGADTVIFYPGYDNCTASQKAYAHLSDANATLGAASDLAHQYMG